VAIAGAGSANHHVGDAIIVLLLVLQPAIQKIVSQLVQLRHLDPQIGHLQLILHVLRIGIGNVDVRWQHPKYHFTIPRGLHVGIPRGAHDIGDVFQDSGHSRKGFLAVVGEISVDVPRLSEIKGSLDVHGRWSEGGEGYDQMGKVKLRLQIQLNGSIFLAILGLPPGGYVGAWLSFIYDLPDAMIFVRIMLGLLTRVAEETLLILQMGQDAESLRRVQTTRGTGSQAVFSADQKITRCRVAGGSLAWMSLDKLVRWIFRTITSAMLGRSLGVHWVPLPAEQGEHNDHDKPQLQHLDVALSCWGRVPLGHFRPGL